MFRTTVLFLIFNVFGLASCDKHTDLPDRDERWSFVVFSDPQFGFGILDKLAENMVNTGKKPLTAFCCGDVLLRSANEAEWLSFYSAMEPVTQAMPLYLARGNHDGNDSVSEACLRQYGRFDPEHFYYTCHEQDVCFIVLDTYERGKSSSIAGDQLKWLRNTLASASSDTLIRHIFLFMHEPLYPQGPRLGENLDNADEIHAIFRANTKIRAVFSGHDHLFNRYIKDGIPYITTGGGGGTLDHGFGGDYYHFTKVTFLKSLTIINVKTIDIFNETIEDFDI